MKNLLIYENKTLVSQQDLGLYSGDIAIIPDAFDGHPRLNWSGAIIGLDQFRIALAFLKWTHDEHHVEGQIRLFYNEFTREWKAVALPQYIWSAGHTREVEEDDPIKSAILEKLLVSGFGPAGTGHHHSGMNAFQSGPDKEDELGQNGFHFTVGHMSSNVADFHCRATLLKINYDPNQGMLDPNQWLPGLHNRAIQDREIAELWLDLKNLPEFPPVWKTYLRAKPAAVITPNTTQWRNPHNPWKSTPSTETTPREMFRDGTITIRFKPSVPHICHRFFIEAKKRPTQVTTTFPEIIPATPEPNQQSDEFRTELITRVSTMTQAEYDDFCQDIRDAANKQLAEQLPANNLNTPSGRVLDRLEECLAEFRDEHIMDHAGATDIRNVCDALEDMSRFIVKSVETTLDKHEGYVTPYLTAEEFRGILLMWGSMLFDQVLTQVDATEWKAVCSLTKAPQTGDITFYDTLLFGLRRAMALGAVDPIYSQDGTCDLR